jgi:5-methyltetrahydrofolate--homocysteine methyltransferase
MGKILELLKKQKYLVSDGAWGTLLQAKGLQAGTCPELWNIDHPEAVSDIARSYIEAGADMTETNSFGGSSCKLAYYGLAERVYEINRAAAALSREAAGPDKIVLGSVGPTGKFLMMGELSPEEMFEVFQQQCQALKEGGADAIVGETMTDLEEAVIAVRAAVKTGMEALCTMTFDALAGGGYRTMMGISPSDMIQALIEAGASV